MADLKNPKLMYLKAGLLLSIGGMAVAVILLEQPSWRLAALLALAIWAFCRAYYFAFYVVEHYIDDDYRFAGLWSFVRYVLRKRRDDHSPR